MFSIWLVWVFYLFCLAFFFFRQCMAPFKNNKVNHHQPKKTPPSIYSTFIFIIWERPFLGWIHDEWIIWHVIQMKISSRFHVHNYGVILLFTLNVVQIRLILFALAFLYKNCPRAIFNVNLFFLNYFDIFICIN